MATRHRRLRWGRESTRSAKSGNRRYMYHCVRSFEVIIIALITSDCVPINPLPPNSPMFSSACALGFACALALVRADVITEGTPIGSLYAYGSGISGLPVIYSDGKTPPLLVFVVDVTDKTNRLCPSWMGKTFVRK